MNSIINRIMAAKQDPGKAAKVLKIKVGSLFGRKNYRKFIILTKSRCGSNLLVSYLNSHPNIYCEGEIFWSLEGRDPSRMLAGAFPKMPANIQAKGFKIFYYHPHDENNCSVWRDLQSMKDLYVIHLQRKNTLRSFVSRKLAEQSQAWMSVHKVQESSADKKVTFSIQELEHLFTEADQWASWGNSIFADNPLLNIYYEDMISESEIFANVLEFLGCKPHRPSSQLRRQNPEPLSSLIENYDELHQHFVDSPWGHMF